MRSLFKIGRADNLRRACGVLTDVDSVLVVFSLAISRPSRGSFDFRTRMSGARIHVNVGQDCVSVWANVVASNLGQLQGS